MSGQIRELGDCHNFGRRVAERDGRIHKPRTVFWEWLLLASESPLREQLRRIASVHRGGVQFDFLPSLKFERARVQGTGPAALAGEVERIALLPLRVTSSDDRRRLAEVSGSAIALYSWLGLSDLHWENLVLGCDPRGQIIFAPLDIELMLEDHALPTATRLLPEADPDYAALYQHACGIRRVLPFLGKPLPIPDLLAMAAAYHQTLVLLDGHAGEIAATLAGLPELREAPLRVCLRSTGDYVRPGGDLDPPLLAAEKEQLQRGDIPYFFRLYGRPGIHYFGDESLATTRRIPGRGDVPTLGDLLSLSRGLLSENRQSLREHGLFCLIAAFDHPSYGGEHTSGDLTVRFAARRLFLRSRGAEELETRRNLSAFVSSVYQPCRCGEVASPLVPRVTRCQG